MSNGLYLVHNIHKAVDGVFLPRSPDLILQPNHDVFGKPGYAPKLLSI